MRGLVPYAKRQARQAIAALQNALHRTNAKLLWALGVLSLVFVPVVVVGWRHDEAATMSTSSIEPAAEESAPASAPPVQKIEKKDIETSTQAPQKTSVNVQTNSEPPKNSVQTRIEVNGHSVAMPKNGTVHKVVSDADGTTTLDISTRSNSSGANDSFSSTDVQLESETYSESEDSP